MISPILEHDAIDHNRAILQRTLAATKFQVSRHAPSADFAPFVQRYWVVTWDLIESGPHQQQLLSYPSVNAAIERGRSGVFGVDSIRGSRVIEGVGVVFGMKFRPGGFYPFINQPISTLTDGMMTFVDAFGVDPRALERTVLQQATPEAMIPLVEQALRPALPTIDPLVDEINRVIDHIIADPTITRVNQLLPFTPNWSKRHLQRLFSRYVGVSPKWVIQRYRLQEAADRLHHSTNINLADMAIELGYFDQAHFIKNFKAIVGVTPTQYLALAAQT